MDQYSIKVLYQQALDQARYWSARPSPEHRPYDNKYKAREVLQRLVAALPEEGPMFKVHTMLANLSIETEETSNGFKFLCQALRIAMKLTEPQNHLVDLIELYNLYGFALVGREETVMGLSVLGKAQEAYQAFCDIGPEPWVYDWLGGGSTEQAEEQHTLTLFYMAQAYTKLGLKDSAALYCGKTLQRQYQSGKFERTEFIADLLGLTDYYNQIHFYGQSNYIIDIARKLLPKDHTELQGKVALASARVLTSFLEYGVHTVKSGGFQPDDERILNKLVFEFADVKTEREKLVPPKDLQDLKGIFRKALGLYKRVQEIFPLNGYVTDHIDCLFEINQLYSSLSVAEPSLDRQLAMIQKRKEGLTPLLKALNPKAYISTCQKIAADIYTLSKESFELRQEMLFGGDDEKLVPQEGKKVKAMNAQADQAIAMAELMMSNARDHEEKKDEKFWRWVIELRMSIAKLQTKKFAYQKGTRVQMLKEGLRTYEECLGMIKEAQKDVVGILQQEEMLIRETVALLPGKIDRINYS